MNKEAFLSSVDDLLTAIDRLAQYDYATARKILRNFEILVNQNLEHTNPFALEHVGNIEADLELSDEYKQRDKKATYWNYAINGLRSDVEALKHETRFPE